MNASTVPAAVPPVRAHLIQLSLTPSGTSGTASVHLNDAAQKAASSLDLEKWMLVHVSFRLTRDQGFSKSSTQICLYHRPELQENIIITFDREEPRNGFAELSPDVYRVPLARMISNLVLLATQADIRQPLATVAMPAPNLTPAANQPKS